MLTLAPIRSRSCAGSWPVMLGTRALLDAHLRDCRDDRARTAEQFNAATAATRELRDEYRRHSEEVRTAQEQRHAENQKKLNQIQRLIYMAAGAVAVLGYLFSDQGHWLVAIITNKH
jgi:hypothetical protein